MNGRALRASIHQAEVGTLQEVAGLWSFQYAASTGKSAQSRCPGGGSAVCRRRS